MLASGAAQAAVDRDALRWDDLSARVYPLIDRAYRLAAVYLGDWSAAEDVVQDAEQNQPGPGPRNPGAFLPRHDLVETAELLRVPLGTVKSRLDRGLTRMRGLLALED